MTRRTIRRYAHELYPHPGEWEVRPLKVEVPYLYARAVGLSVWETDYFDLCGDDDTRVRKLATNRLMEYPAAAHKALLADALLQGMTGDEAWAWATEAQYESQEWMVLERAKHYGIPVYLIKPYFTLADLPTHAHYATTGNVTGFGLATQVDMPESECPDCTEEVPDGED